MRAYLRLQLVLATAIFFTCANSLYAQVGASLSQLNGTVVDQSDRSVVKAALTLRETETNRTYSTVSNENGFYVFANAQPGRYELVAEAAGFARTVQTGIVLTVGQFATVNVSLKIAAVGEKVEVTTEVPVIEPNRTEISQVIETQQIGSLPVSGRLFTDFALLTPGVATGRTSLGTTFTEFEITQISFGGQRSFSNEITVDGADFINSNTGVQRSTPPQESVQEFRVVNNSFGSEYGRALGGIVNVVTKSGTNDRHGSVYDYLQNDAVDARSFLQPAPAPHTLRQNQFGGTISGPLKTDKTFFFMNYEGQRRGESPTLPPDFAPNLTVPSTTPGFAPFTGINPAKAYMGIPFEASTTLKTKDNDYGFARLDHQFNANNRLSLRFNIEDARDLNQLVGNTEDGGGIGTPSGGRNLFIRDQSLVGTLDSALKPNLINTALVQYARRHYNFPGATGEPDLSLPNDLEFGHNFGTLDAIYESRIQFSDSLAWVKGSHVAKFGFDTNYLWDYTKYPGFTPTRIILPGLNCMIDFANFMNSKKPSPALPLAQLPGPPCPVGGPLGGVGATFYGVALARTGYAENQPPLNNQFPLDRAKWANAFPTQLTTNYDFTLNHGYDGFFAQDQWRVTHKLTLNYGMRYDFETGLSRQIDSYWKAFQPRVGLAFSPDSKTVIRAGFGIFFDRNNMTFFFITGDQKTLPNKIPGITLPMIRTGADTGGWQLNLVTAAAVSPAPLNGVAGCSAGFLLPNNACLSSGADVANFILSTGTYPNQVLTGPCDPTNNLLNCTGGAGGLDRHHHKLPYAEQASLEIDRQLGKGLTISAGYLFVGAHRLVLGNGLNTACPVGTSKANPAAQGWLNADGTISPCTGTPKLLVGKPYFTGVSSFPPGPPTQFYFGQEFNNGGFLDYNYGIVNANYHGLTVQAIERAGKYFNFNGNYTFSHSIDDGNFTTFINLPQNQFDNKSERGNSNQDVRHRFVANFTAQTPDRNFLRNFAFSSIITVQTGRPFSMFTGGDSNGDTNPVTDRVGLSGRNTYTGDPLRAWDLRVSRYFRFREKAKIDLALDVFNLFNRPNVDEVFSVYGSPVFCGAVPKQYKDSVSAAIQTVSASVTCPTLAQLGNQIPPEVLLGPPFGPAQFHVPGTLGDPFPFPNPNFGKARTMLNPRQLQLSLKLSF